MSEQNEIRIRVEVDETCSDPEVLIRTNEENDRVRAIIAAIEQCVDPSDSRIAAYQGDTLVLIEQREIIRIYTERRRLILRTAGGQYEVRSTLQKIEPLLNPAYFLRASRFEIINIRRAERFDFSVAGTVNVTFDDGSSTWVARRCVRTIQEALDRLVGRKGGKA